MKKFILESGYTNYKKVKAIKKCKERLQNDNYTSSIAKAMDEKFVRQHEDYIFVMDWCNEHFNEFNAVPAVSRPQVTEHNKEIKLPYFDKTLKKYIPVNGELRMWYNSQSHHHHPFFQLKHKCSWDETDRFMGERFDWQPSVCKEILLNQDRMEEWCDELTKSYLDTEYYYAL
jgi:hypothetical protein